MLEVAKINTRYLTLLDANGAAVTGQIEINFPVKRAANEDSGNVSGVIGTIVEVDATNQPGLYKVPLDLGAHPTGKSWHLEIEHDSGVAFALDEVSTVALADVALARKALTNRLELDPVTDVMTLYDDDDAPLLTHTVTDKDGNTLSVSPGVPARRGKGT